MRESLHNESLALVAMASATHTNGTVNGSSVDTGLYGNDFKSVLFVIVTGTITDGTHTFAIEESANNSTWAAAVTSRIQGTVPAVAASDDDKVFQFGYSPTKQYVRIKVTTTGATTGGVYSAVAVLFDASANPVARS